MIATVQQTARLRCPRCRRTSIKQYGRKAESEYYYYKCGNCAEPDPRTGRPQPYKFIVRIVDPLASEKTGGEGLEQDL